MLERAERASHIDPPASSYAIIQRASPYCGENPGPGKDVHGELEPRPGIREQPGSFSTDPPGRQIASMSGVPQKVTCPSLPPQALGERRHCGLARRLIAVRGRAA